MKVIVTGHHSCFLTSSGVGFKKPSALCFVMLNLFNHNKNKHCIKIIAKSLFLSLSGTYIISNLLHLTNYRDIQTQKSCKSQRTKYLMKDTCSDWSKEKIYIIINDLLIFAPHTNLTSRKQNNVSSIKYKYIYIL